MKEFIFRPTKCPNKFVQITDEVSGEVTLNYNDEYLNWKKIDQLLFDLVIVTITAKKREITLPETQFLLMSFEARLEQFATHTTIELPVASANVLHRIHKGELLSNFLRENQSFREQFRGCGKGRSNRFNNYRPTCQLCGKPGHFATICYHRYDQFTGYFGRQQGSAVQVQENLV
ncbi:hypothetical protein ACOSQ3_023305 [Xanthoceras sorbifolium]